MNSRVIHFGGGGVFLTKKNHLVRVARGWPVCGVMMHKPTVAFEREQVTCRRCDTFLRKSRQLEDEPGL